VRLLLIPALELPLMSRDSYHVMSQLWWQEGYSIKVCTVPKH